MKEIQYAHSNLLIINVHILTSFQKECN